MRIIFMGTPDFAVASLDALLKSNKEVVAVVTSPDKPAGRGQKLHESAVKQYAVQHNIPVLQPEKLRDPEFLAALESFKADLQIIVAFRMLPEVVWNMPPLGTVNVHASLLPQYRGAAPINHVLINGETKTGVTTFLLQHKIDTGNILFSKEVSIREDENAGELHDELMQAGAETLLKTIEAIEQNQLKPIPQEEAQQGQELKEAPKIFREDCKIDWNRPVDDVYNLIRGLSPYPAAFSYIDNKVLKIYATAKEIATPSVEPGTILSDGKTFIKIAAKDGFLHILNLQLEGKKKMEVVEFLRGYRMS
ncbi:methionyl-tRNA formyltransferase [Sphingobacterium hungaricum]|uniref:Methionyl-tRNA formyltransferase n=1 Tax=Sphingobacterium hungaricum TaxID=2082723 RepID=A0A928UZV1_9SPHI|nr:methionyl-tRNA formyltransferase [Sphingobacterium hungaricum]MBE8714485.1 methionyl-tRNA formyltransferase [Sphingobacterium hungaricum]